MNKSITQDMAYRQSLMKYAEKYGVSCVTNNYKREQAYFFCSSYLKNSEVFSAYYIREKVVEQIVLESMQRILLNVQAFLYTETDKTKSLQCFIQKVKPITELKALTPELIHEFVDKIVVYAPKTIDGKRVQLLDIYYSGVGILYELTTPEEMEEAFQQHLIERNKEKTA